MRPSAPNFIQAMSASDHRRVVASAAVASARRDLADLRDLAIEPSVERAVAAVRDVLGMDVAYATEFVDGQQVFRVLRGEGDSFGMEEGLQFLLSTPTVSESWTGACQT